MRWLRKKLLNFVLRDMFCAILEEDIVSWKNLTQEEQAVLIEEATWLKKSRLFSRILSSMRDSAKKRMFEKSQSWDDMFFGKACLYVVETLKSKIDVLSKMK